MSKMYRLKYALLVITSTNLFDKMTFGGEGTRGGAGGGFGYNELRIKF